MRKITQMFPIGTAFDGALCDDGTTWIWSGYHWKPWAEPIPQDEPEALPELYDDKIVLPYSIDGYLWLVDRTDDVILTQVESWTDAIRLTTEIRNLTRGYIMALVLAEDAKTATRRGHAWLANNRTGLFERSVEHQGQTVTYVDGRLPF